MGHAKCTEHGMVLLNWVRSAASEPRYIGDPVRHFFQAKNKPGARGRVWQPQLYASGGFPVSGKAEMIPAREWDWSFDPVMAFGGMGPPYLRACSSHEGDLGGAPGRLDKGVVGVAPVYWEKSGLRLYSFLPPSPFSIAAPSIDSVSVASDQTGGVPRAVGCLLCIVFNRAARRDP